MKVMSGNMEIRLEKLSDEQIAKRMSKYISMLESISVRAEYYSDGNCPEKERDELSSDYVKVRDSIREDARYLNYGKDKKGSSLLWDKYYPSVSEASAWGLYADPDGKFDKEYFKSISDAEKRLIKYYSYDYWRIIAEE
ncbi:MAG: hypothetical protein U0L11_09555 [Acutalibacteraceae bacterium]|nr:hypothetical protein [Acutalibacteraceae bacterium]